MTSMTSHMPAEIGLTYPAGALLTSPFTVTMLLAVGLHAGLLFVHFKSPPRPYQEPDLDITLLHPADNPQQYLSVPEWQPDLTPLRPPPEEPLPEPVTTTAAQPTQVTKLITDEVPEIEQPEDPPVSAALLRQASLSAMRELPEVALAPESVRRKYVSANTQEWKYLSYMRAWTDKVERVGNLNYPEQARREGLRGSLVVSVGVLADGSLESIEILRSSGFDILDQAAINIVELSAPFAALPEEIVQETDILYITRTWRFTPDQGLTN